MFETVVTPAALDLASAVIRSGQLSTGPRVVAFEDALARELRLSHPVALNSGTSALHLALVLAGVGPGDEVVLAPQTFVATAQAILMQRAVPVFADIDPLTGNLAVESLTRALTPPTKAIIAVHWAGYPCDLDEIGACAALRGIPVIEDAAHALGASYRGRAIGSVSRFTCFSFQAIKHVTCGDGGALCCVHPDDALEARRRRWFGIDREHALPSELGEREFDIDAVGYKYHMNDLAAAVGLGNLSGFRDRLARRRTIVAAYRTALARVSGVTLLRRADDRQSADWLCTILVERRDAFVRALQSHGVPTSVVHRRIDRFRVCGGVRAELAGQQQFDERQISLPLHSGLSDEQVDQVMTAVRCGW